MNETRRKPTTGRQSPSLFDKRHGIFYMPSRIDEAGHTKAFDYPVAEQWGWSRNVQVRGWDSNRQHIGSEANALLQLTGVYTLAERRNDICKEYFNKMKRYATWTKECTIYALRLRNINEFHIPKARTNQYKNTLLYHGHLANLNKYNIIGFYWFIDVHI